MPRQPSLRLHSTGVLPVLAAAALTASCLHAADPFEPQVVSASPPVRHLDFALHDVYGREVRAADYRGVPLLLEFGACW